jgi:hypothetical protein
VECFENHTETGPATRRKYWRRVPTGMSRDSCGVRSCARDMNTSMCVCVFLRVLRQRQTALEYGVTCRDDTP